MNTVWLNVSVGLNSLRMCAVAVGIGLLAVGCLDEPDEIEVLLTAQVPDAAAGRSLRWSPKGEKLFLVREDGSLLTYLHLGTDGTPPFPIRLEKGEHQTHYNRLLIDHDHDGQYRDNELYETVPEEIRGRMWSSFDAVVDIPVVDPVTGGDALNPYPLSFWFVEEPESAADELVLRYSRRGWMEGHVEIEGVEAVVLLTENLMDGVYDYEDYWAMASSDSADNVFLLSYARPAKRHAWLLEKAYLISEIHPSGRRLVLTPFDPGVTRAEEAEMDDDLAEDRRAARSGDTVAFLHDFAEAQQLALTDGKMLFVDFETEWCGPCHIMDEWVYTADAVVAASASYVSVKVDGDESPDLTQRFLVGGYPTMLVVAADGTVLRRAAGYMSVVEMTEFLAEGR